MRILVATSEAVPFAKTGGLADVSGSLPVELARLGHQTTLIMPAYRQIRNAGLPIEETGIPLEIPIGSKVVPGTILKSHLPGGKVPVYFIQQDDYFDRDTLYGPNSKDYRDNCERFVFFCRAVMEAIRLLDLHIDVIHCNDWQTGLIPAYLKIEYGSVPRYEHLGCLFTIHNMHFQGKFWHWDMLLTGLDWKYFNWHQMEFFGSLNLLKTGLVFADSINTVSPRYAEEIQSPEFGCGLEGVLQQRRAVVSGIINGVDYGQWNPKTDSHLAMNFGPDDVAQGKIACKAALQAEVGFPTAPRVPLLGFVGRLTDQKGVDLIAAVMQDWVNLHDVQWVLLGTGEPKYQELFKTLAQRNPRRVAYLSAFSDPTAHRIEASADLFLMPSQFEPCGLNQLYSLKYGTAPVVRAVGGLADTITDTNDATLAAGTANGFSFREYSPLALAETLRRACALYAEPERWQKILKVGMRQDWSWSASAKQYVNLYQQTIARAQQPETVASR